MGISEKKILAIAEEAEKWRAKNPDPDLPAAVRPTDLAPPKVVLSVRVDGVLAERLAQAAHQAHASVSDLVRVWLTDRLQAENEDTDRMQIANDLEHIARLIRGNGDSTPRAA